jgi:acyl-CoA thioesterase
VSSFAAVTAVQPRPDDPLRYDVMLDAGWTIGGRPNGGYLLAAMARAGCLALDAPVPLVVSGHFLRAPEPGPAEIAVEVTRLGRRVSQARTTLWQNQKPCLDALVSAGAPPTASSDPDWTDLSEPDLTPPEDCPTAPPENFEVELFNHIDLRVDTRTAPFPTPSGHPVVRAWFRLLDDEPIDVFGVLLAVDALPPTVFNLGKFGWAPTVELTVVVRGVPSPGWLKVEARTRAVIGGWFDEEAAVWDSQGRLVAQSRQLALTAT